MDIDKWILGRQGSIDPNPPPPPPNLVEMDEKSMAKRSGIEHISHALEQPIT